MAIKSAVLSSSSQPVLLELPVMLPSREPISTELTSSMLPPEEPEVLVLDEPAAGLDPLGKQEIMRLLHDLHGGWCKTVVIVSHDMDEIAENCNRVAVFEKGVVVAVDTPRKLFSSAEKLYDLGLDIPYTAKITSLLKEKGIEIDCNYTVDDFVKNTLLRVTKEVEANG